MLIRRSPDILPSEITDQDLYLNRRKFLTVAGVTLGAALVGGKTAPAFSALPPSMAVAYGVPDGRRFFELARALFRERWHGEAVIQVQVTATHLHNTSGQLELFTPDEVRTIQRFAAIDGINRKYGEFTISPATILGRSSMPNVIAPAWRPDGHRQHIPD